MNETLTVTVTEATETDEGTALTLMSFNISAQNVAAPRFLELAKGYADMYVYLSDQRGEKLSLADFGLWLLTRPEAL